MADDPQNNNGPKKEEDNKEELTVLSRIIQELRENRETEEEIDQRRIRREKALRRIKLTVDAALWAVRWRKNHKDIRLANELAQQRYDKQIQIGETSEEDLQRIDHDIKDLPRALGEFLTGNEESSSDESIELLKRIANGVEGNFKTAEGEPQNGGKDDGGPLKKKGPGVFARVGKAIGDVIGGVIEGIGNAFANIGKKAFKVLKGALAVAAIGVALIPAAAAFQMFSEVSWGGVAAGLVVLTALVVGVMALGAIMSSGIGTVAILAGAAALAILGVAMIPAAYAFELFGKALNNHVAPALKSFGETFSLWITTLTGGFSNVLDSLGGFVLDSGTSFSNVVTAVTDGFADIITATGTEAARLTTATSDGFATVIVAFADAFCKIGDTVGGFISGTLESLTLAFDNAVTTIEGFMTSLVTNIRDLSEIDGIALGTTAAGITAVATALALFGATGLVGAAIGAIAGTFDKLSGSGGPMAKLNLLAKLADPLDKVGVAMERIALAFKTLGEDLNFDIMDKTGIAAATLFRELNEGLKQISDENVEKLELVNGLLINARKAAKEEYDMENAGMLKRSIDGVLSVIGSGGGGGSFKGGNSVNNVTYNDHGLMDRTSNTFGNLN